MNWIKASDRLPVLPNVLPLDTKDERGVLFVNRTHSAGVFWYSSYGQSPTSIMNLQFDGWSLDQWEWLEENVKPVEGETITDGYDILKELKTLDTILDGDGFKDWCYVRLALAEATKAMKEKLQTKNETITGVEEAAKAALSIAESVTPELSASEQALFIAGFQECIKWQAQQAKQPVNNHLK